MALLKTITHNWDTNPYTDKYKDSYAITDVIGYGLNEYKTYGYVGGWGIDPYNAAQEMELLAKLWHKQSGTRLRTGSYPSRKRKSSAR